MAPRIPMLLKSLISKKHCYFFFFLLEEGGRDTPLIGQHFFYTNCSSMRSVSGLTALEKGREFYKGICSGLTQSPSTWEVDAFIECLPLWDELWTNAQNCHWHQQAERKREQSPAVQFSCEPTMERLFRAKPQPTPRTAVLLTARLAILPLQSFFKYSIS